MGRKLDALLGRNFRASKFKTLVKLAVSRIAFLKNQHRVRCSLARSDVIELLQLGHHDRALLRVEQVIREQNMLDAFVMIENYCHLLIERVVLIQKNKERDCPDELKEAISSLIFAASRSGEFPELQQIRGELTSKFGKDMAVRSVELRNNCGVDPKMIQKFSTRRPSLENKMKILKEIASANNIALHFEEDAPANTEEKLGVEQKQKKPEPEKPRNLDNLAAGSDKHELSEEFKIDEKLSESIKGGKMYKDVAAAAREAFKSAAYAAAAARAAFELSRSELQDNNADDQTDSDDHDKMDNSEGSLTPEISNVPSESNDHEMMDNLEASLTAEISNDQSDSNDHKKVDNSKGSLTPEISGDECESSEGSKHSNYILEFDNIHPVDNFSLDTEGSDMAEKINQTDQEEMQDDKEKEVQRMPPANSSDSHKGILIGNNLSSKSDLVALQDDIQKILSANNSDSHTESSNDGKLSSDQSCENDQFRNEIVGNRVHDLDLELKCSLPTTESEIIKENKTVEEENLLKEDEENLPNRSPKWIPLNSRADTTKKPMAGTSTLTSTQSLISKNHPLSDHLVINKKWVSVRTRTEHHV
ncbi:dentin sialophosphoprotein-like [Carica papaya]|uniref:dentin sialophosphoprotein-like n=1 Tax=Carica papaya TaxID=3649 RepID=UPI000B8C9C19|nr:dentin sialophosphoprotein-like [Carica papaya]